MRDDDFPSVGSGPSLLDDDTDPHRTAKRGAGVMAIAWVFGFLMAIAGAATAAFLAWSLAPPVGGEWWPYIRVAVALVAAVAGGKVGVLVAWIVVSIAMIVGAGVVRVIR